MRAAREERRKTLAAKAKEPVAALAPADVEPQGSSLDAATLVLLPLLALATILFAAAAISPAYVPRRVATRLEARRIDLAVVGFAAAGVALFSFFVQRLGS